MSGVAAYILSVAAAAIIVSIVSVFVTPKSGAGVLIKLIGGLYLTIVAVQPLANFDFQVLTSFWTDFSLEATAASQEGEEKARQAMGDIIKAETEAYILDKAGCMADEMTVQVFLSDDPVPVPESVRICCDLPEAARLALQKQIAEELDIPEENQTWIGLP